MIYPNYKDPEYFSRFVQQIPIQLRLATGDPPIAISCGIVPANLSHGIIDRRFSLPRPNGFFHVARGEVKPIDAT